MPTKEELIEKADEFQKVLDDIGVNSPDQLRQAFASFKDLTRVLEKFQIRSEEDLVKALKPVKGKGGAPALATFDAVLGSKRGGHDFEELTVTPSSFRLGGKEGSAIPLGTKFTVQVFRKE